MSLLHAPHHSSPPAIGPQDTSLSHSDRSLRSMHSAPSLTNTGSSSFNSSVLSSTNLNVHSIPLPVPHPHGHNDNDKENIHTHTRPLLKRMRSERTVAESFRPTLDADHDPHMSWRVSEHGMLDAYEHDNDDEDEGGSEYNSISGETDDLRRTLFYRPSTDPIQVRPESELDPELSAVLRSMSNTNLVAESRSASPTPHPAPLAAVREQPEPEPEPLFETSPRTSPPIRPTRPASLDLSDTHEPAMEPKRVDLKRHSRRSSRDRLSMLLGLASSGSSPRPSLQGARPSSSGQEAGHTRAQSHSSGTTASAYKDKGKSPLVDTPEEPPEDWLHVQESVGTSSAIDFGRPRARTYSAHSRARTISSISRQERERVGVGESSQDMGEMCRSVWEDDETESFEYGKGWGLVRRWLGEDAGASTSTPVRRHVPKALSLASTISAFRTPNVSMSPLFGEGGLMGAKKSPGPDDSLTRDTITPTPAPPKSATETGTGRSRISFQSFFTAESKQTKATLEASTPASAYASLTVPSSETHSVSRNSASFVSARSSSPESGMGPEPESPTITAKRFRTAGALDVPDVPIKTSRALFSQTPPGSGLGLEFEASTSRSTAGLPSPPTSPHSGPQETPRASPQETTPRVPNTYVTPVSPVPRHRPPIPRALASPTYASLHSRLGSPLRNGPTNEEGWAPMSPFLSPSTLSPGWSPVSPLPRSPASPVPKAPVSPGAGPSSPLGFAHQLDSTYHSDVRPLSGWTESSYRPSVEGAWSKRDSATTAKRESDATFAGRQSFANQPLLVPPRMKTVRIVETGNGNRNGDSWRSEVMSVRAKREPRGPLLPSPPASASGIASIYKFRPGGPHLGPRMRVNRKQPVGAGFTPRAWFLMGFLLGPWCWLVGGWMTHYHAPIAVLDVEKSSGRVFEGGAWIKRCRIASVVSGFVVFGGALVAVIWAAIGTR